MQNFGPKGGEHCISVPQRDALSLTPCKYGHGIRQPGKRWPAGRVLDFVMHDVLSDVLFDVRL